MGFSLELLVAIFEQAIKEKRKYVAVAVQIEGASRSEVIINSSENLESKKAYYANAYDEYAKLKANPNIRIAYAVAGDTFAQIEDQIGWSEE